MCVQVSMQYTYLIIYLLLIMINEIIMYLMKILNLVNKKWIQWKVVCSNIRSVSSKNRLILTFKYYLEYLMN